MRGERLRRIAVIGGGPGGAQCARRLAESGLDVTVFEPREHFEKACGGGIPIRGMERFAFLFDPALPGKEIGRCLIVSPAGREARLPLGDPLYVFSRGDLHTFLLNRALAAGASLVRARVTGMGGGGGDAGPWTVRATASRETEGREFGPFDFLIAADGAAGMTRRRLLRVSRREETSQGLGYYVPGVSEDFITLKFYGDLHGYLWVFPRPDHSSAGICARLGERPAAALQSRMDTFLEERYPEAALQASKRYAALIPHAPREPATDPPLGGEGWALIGDAARLVDPLTREGIYYAMLSGDLLAEALGAGRPELYPEAWTRAAAGELSWAAGHGEVFFAPRFIERLVFLAGSSPSIARVLSDLIAGRQAYRTLKRRLLKSAPLVAAQVARRAVRIPLLRPRDS